MHGKFGNSSIQPYTFGLTPQTSVYGTTIPVILGRIRAALYLTWCASLRPGGTSGKAIKSSKQKTGGTNYTENVDFLLGHSPINGVLQFWTNNNTQIYLNFPGPEQLAITPGSATSYVMMDPDFYYLLGVTLTLPMNWTDLTCAGGATTLTSATGGFVSSIVGAYIQITSGSGGFVPGTYQVVKFNNQGSLTLKTSPAPSSSGTGGVGSIAFNDYGGQGIAAVSGTYEIPLWNAINAGPNRINNSAWRYYPYVYSCGPYESSITFDQNAYGALPSGTLNFYYAQLAQGGAPNLQVNLFFESVLGDNTGGEYNGNDHTTDVLLSTQQIEYPMYAGLGSSTIDLGTTQAIPSIVPEVVGAFGVYPTGDCDFADMIEDAFMGTGQSANGTNFPTYAAIQHGLNCFEFPGAIQKKLRTWTGAINTIFTDLCNTMGSIMVVVARNDSSSALSVSGGTFTAQIGGSPAGEQVWTSAPVGSNGTFVVPTISPTSTNTDLEIIEFNGLNEIDNVVTAVGTGGTISASITTTNNQGEYSYIMAIVIGSSSGTNIQPTSLPVPWNPLMVGVGLTWSAYRIVKAPATYTFTVPSGVTGGWRLVLIAFKNSTPIQWPFALGYVLDDPSMQLVRNQCRAFGLFGSVFMSSQKEASAWLEDFYRAADAAPVWSGFTLKSIPYSEVSAAGNGAVYVAPTASGPVANLGLTGGDFIGDSKDTIITIDIKAQVDSTNIIQIQHPARTAQYNEILTTGPEQSTITTFGPRKPKPVTSDCIVDPQIARLIAGIESRKQSYLRNTYKFKLQAKWILLEPMDLVTLTDPQIGLFQFPVRITSIEEDEKYNLDCEAEPFMYGLYSPAAVTIGAYNGYQPATNYTPQSINTPVMFEPVGAIAGNPSANELWLFASNSDVNYGGCQVYISVDGGNSYDFYGTITGNAVTGVTYNSDWPAAADPDVTNNLYVNLSESNGTLESNSGATKDGHVIPLYVASPSSWTDLFTSGPGATTLSSTSGGFSLALPGQFIVITTNSGNWTVGSYQVASVTDQNDIVLSASPTPLGAASGGGGYITSGFQLPTPIEPFVPYELVDFSTATLTASNEYELVAATNGGLRRATYGAPLAGNGVDHPIGSRVALCNPNGQGRLAIELTPRWVGQQLMFKFCAFNTYGAGIQSLTAATPYSYTPSGITLATSQAVPYQLSPAIPISYTSYSGATALISTAAVEATFPTSTARYTARSYNILNSGGVGNYYLTIFDPNQAGDYNTTWTDLAYKKATAPVPFTDLSTTSAGSTEIVTASALFTVDMVGQVLAVTSGTNFVSNDYLIVSYIDSNHITVAQSPTPSGAGSGGHAQVQFTNGVLTSATGGFTTAMIGSWFYFTSGANFLLGPYPYGIGIQLVAVINSNTVLVAGTVRLNPSVNSSGGHAYLQLQTFADTTPVRTGQPGYVYLGFFQITPGSPPVINAIMPGGWPQPTQDLLNGS